MKKGLLKVLVGVISVVAIIAGAGAFADTGKRAAMPKLIEAKPFDLKEKGVAILTKAYTYDEARAYVGKTAARSGYQAIQVVIQNNSDKSFVLLREDVGLPMVAPKEIAKKVLTGSIARSVVAKVAGFFFWPIAIPSAVDGIHTYHRYNKTKNDLMAKSIDDVKIPAYSSITRVIFVPKGKATEKFQVKLFHEQMGKFVTFETQPV